MSIEETAPLLGEENGESIGDQHDNGPEVVSSKQRRNLAGTAILLTLTLERLAFYSLISNLYLYLNRHPFNWMSYNAMMASYVCTGVAYLTAVPGGWLADSFLGKFYTILLGLVIYAVGYSGMVYIASSGHEISPLCKVWPNDVPAINHSDADLIPRIRGIGIMDLKLYSNFQMPPMGYVGDDHPPSHEDPETRVEICGWTVYIVLVILASAVGIIRANIAPFGADQFKHVAVDSMRRFFNLYYWCVNIGAFVAVGAVAYIQQSLSNGFYIGYLIPAAAIGVAIVIFIFGRPCYVVRRPTGSVLINVIRIVVEAWRSKKRHRIRMERQRSLPIDLPSPSDNSLTVPSCLDMAKVRYGGSFHETAVEDVKSLGKIIVVFTALIPYWLVYFQMQTSFLAQGLHMKLNPYAPHVTNKSDIPRVENTFTIPAAWLTLFDVCFLLILIPLMDRVVYPFLDRRQIHLSALFKITLGMVFSLIAVILSGGLEFYRLNLIHTNNSSLIIQVIGNTSYISTDIWIFWQIPQYGLIGISEVFASVASKLSNARKRFVDEAPKSMQGMVMGLHSLCTGIGSFLGTGLLEAVRPFWFTRNDFGSLNESNLDYYFFLLSAIQFVTILLFVAVATKYNLVTRDFNGHSMEASISTQGPSEDLFSSSRRRISRRHRT